MRRRMPRVVPIVFHMLPFALHAQTTSKLVISSLKQMMMCLIRYQLRTFHITIQIMPCCCVWFNDEAIHPIPTVPLWADVHQTDRMLKTEAEHFNFNLLNPLDSLFWISSGESHRPLTAILLQSIAIHLPFLYDTFLQMYVLFLVGSDMYTAHLYYDAPPIRIVILLSSVRVGGRRNTPKRPIVILQTLPHLQHHSIKGLQGTCRQTLFRAGQLCHCFVDVPTYVIGFAQPCHGMYLSMCRGATTDGELSLPVAEGRLRHPTNHM